jgi:hypothetical protein
MNKKQADFLIKYCPCCGESLLNPKSLLNEFWIANDTAYFCWCYNCSWQGEIVEVQRITAPELAGE